MTLWPYSTRVVHDRDGNKAFNSTGTLYAIDDATLSAPVTARDALGAAITVTSDESGVLNDFFLEDHTSALWKTPGFDKPFVVVTSAPVPGAPGEPGRDGSNVLPTSEAVYQELESGNSAALLSATTARRRAHVILLWGQSNMSGRGAGHTMLTDPTVPRILQYGSKTRTLRAASEPLDMHDTPSGIGPGLQFARHYLAALPKDDIVVLVPSAHGGTALSTNTSPLGWRWGVSGNLSAQAVMQANEALAVVEADYQGMEVGIDAILWLQGETDSSTANMISAVTYMADLDALVAGARSTFSNPDLPFIIGQMLPEALGTGTRDEINAAHANTPYRVAHTGFSLSAPPGNSNGDLLHFNAAGQRINGKNMFEEYQRVRVGLAPVNLDGDFPAVLVFSDTFTRADGPLGTTEQGNLEWTTVGSGAVPSVYSNTAGIDPSGSITRAIVDTGETDGVLTATLTTANVEANGQLIFRRASATSELLLSRQSSASKVWTLFKRVSGTASVVFASATPIASGDQLEVRMEGTTLNIKVNGAEIYDGTNAAFGTGGTFTGFSATSNGDRWDDFEFWTL